MLSSGSVINSPAIYRLGLWIPTLGTRVQGDPSHLAPVLRGPQSSCRGLPGQKAVGVLKYTLLKPHHPVLRQVLSPTPLLGMCMLPVPGVSIFIFFFNISLPGQSEAVRKEAANYYRTEAQEVQSPAQGHTAHEFQGQGWNWVSLLLARALHTPEQLRSACLSQWVEGVGGRGQDH